MKIHAVLKRWEESEGTLGGEGYIDETMENLHALTSQGAGTAPLPANSSFFLLAITHIQYNKVSPSPK